MSALASMARTIGRFGRNRIPPQLVVQITNRCNASCPQCGMRRSADIARFDLPDAVMERILGDCAAKGVQAISFTGGEPLLMLRGAAALAPGSRPGRDSLYPHRHQRVSCCGAPSGPIFTARIQRLAEALAATPLRNFWISLDSARARGARSACAGCRAWWPGS